MTAYSFIAFSTVGVNTLVSGLEVFFLKYSVAAVSLPFQMDLASSMVILAAGAAFFCGTVHAQDKLVYLVAETDGTQCTGHALDLVRERNLNFFILEITILLAGELHDLLGTDAEGFFKSIRNLGFTESAVRLLTEAETLEELCFDEGTCKGKGKND